MPTRWLYVPFKDREEVLAMAREWRTQRTDKDFRVVERGGDLSGVRDGDTVYLLGHGVAGCQELVNREEKHTEGIGPDELAGLLFADEVGLQPGLQIKLKIWACSAGASAGFGQVFGQTFANLVDNQLPMSKVFDYSHTITSPCFGDEWKDYPKGDGRKGDYPKVAVSDQGLILGRAKEFRNHRKAEG